jgi:hypothetical protein
MKLRPDVVIFAVLLVGAAFAVWSQLDANPSRGTATRLGEVFADATLTDIGHQPRSIYEIGAGKKATVLYFWSVECPCVDALEARMKQVIERYEPLGVTFIAIASHPSETRDQVFEKMEKIHATAYRMLLDPTQAVLKRAGCETATEIVVLDAEHRLRFRGAMDDDLIRPKQAYLAPALDAVLEGRAPSPAQTKPYGCPFPGFDGVCAFE